MAIEGMRLIAKYLPRAYQNGADVEARAFMLAAASMGAAAFQKGLGAVHALAHPIGAVFDTHHGLTNAVLLPYVMVHNRAAIAERMTAIGRVLGLAHASFDGVLAWVLEIRRMLGIPRTLQKLNVTDARADEIGRMAAQDPSAAGNPAPVDAAALATIFRNAVAGRVE
jgi:alcohol dehydrogenase class IV